MALNPALAAMVSKQRGKYSGNTGNAIKPKVGQNRYRILAPAFGAAPWIPSTGQWWADLGVHWIKPDLQDASKPIAVVGDCDTVHQLPSVLNTAIDMAINSATDETSKKIYESWKSRKTVVLNVIDRDDKTNQEPQILELTTTTFGKILETYTNYAAEGLDITDPVDGVDLIITRTGVSLTTKYDVAVAPKSTPIDPELVGKAADLPAWIEKNFFRGEEQKALNAISQIAGVVLPRLGGPVRTPTPALTSSSAVVADAATATVAPVVAAVVEAPPVVDTAAAELATRRAALLAKRATEDAELLAMETPTPVVFTKPVTALSVSEEAAILAELDGLVVT